MVVFYRVGFPRITGTGKLTTKNLHCQRFRVSAGVGVRHFKFVTWGIDEKSRGHSRRQTRKGKSTSLCVEAGKRQVRRIGGAAKNQRTWLRDELPRRITATNYLAGCRAYDALRHTELSPHRWTCLGIASAFLGTRHQQFSMHFSPLTEAAVGGHLGTACLGRTTA